MNQWNKQIWFYQCWLFPFYVVMPRFNGTTDVWETYYISFHVVPGVWRSIFTTGLPGENVHSWPMKTMIQDQWKIMFDVSTLYNFSSHEINSVSKQNITNPLVGAACIFIYNIFSKSTLLLTWFFCMKFCCICPDCAPVPGSCRTAVL